MIARRLVIHGRVQGVGYRESMVVAARAAGVDGWVRNRRDGSVEALLQGDPAAVDRVIDWARHGPSFARVTAIDIADWPPAALSGFARAPTE
ncbi:MAG: acylphosphatase [Betaproteobacteria bacterium]|jgi:acylphosphatase|nr:acylphosphatase [Betaproteobacteria bacterium]MBK6601400.1 acylphosphatase [Betaproteobacteria bacterium]MBK7079648.1 acylphosphatase [Betaproteobacteria bacterium]MBK7592645.1 acylphosphatase [Betaproteobacteria bacterium]MBK7742945.1 acylphosphatase [Betaproteobacteria bacterium]